MKKTQIVKRPMEKVYLSQLKWLAKTLGYRLTKIKPVDKSVAK